MTPFLYTSCAFFLDPFTSTLPSYFLPCKHRPRSQNLATTLTSSVRLSLLQFPASVPKHPFILMWAFALCLILPQRPYGGGVVSLDFRSITDRKCLSKRIMQEATARKPSLLSIPTPFILLLDTLQCLKCYLYYRVLSMTVETTLVCFISSASQCLEHSSHSNIC